MSPTGRGAATAFWVKVKNEMDDVGWDKSELAKRSGLARTTIDGLESGKRRPTVKTVHALADLFHIDRKEARRLAGLAPPEPAPVSVREAILASSVYTAEQKSMLLAMLDTIDRANAITPTD